MFPKYKTTIPESMLKRIYAGWGKLQSLNEMVPAVVIAWVNDAVVIAWVNDEGAATIMRLSNVNYELKIEGSKFKSYNHRMRTWASGKQKRFENLRLFIPIITSLNSCRVYLFSFNLSKCLLFSISPFDIIKDPIYVPIIISERAACVGVKHCLF